MEKLFNNEKLTSPQNPKFKLALELINSKGRKRHGLFIAEGLREMQIAAASGFVPVFIFFNSEFADKKGLQCLKTFQVSPDKIYELDKKLLSRVAYREDTEGIAGVFEIKKTPLSELSVRKNPLILVLESVEKPGNLGAVLRTADAAAVDAVFICDPVIDLYNPNVIRSSIGCIFSQKIIACTSAEAIDWFRKQKITVFAAALTADKYYHENDYREGTAIVLGTEANGLSDTWLKNCDVQIKIPMLGKIDSLNVSNATAILAFEAMRQRNFIK